MNDFRLSPDDPKLTAYALGELEGDERAAVEAALRTDPVARAAVEEIRATAAKIEAAFVTEAEAAAEKDDEPSAVPAGILPGRDVTKLDGGGQWGVPTRGPLIRFPQFYYLIGGLAAACFAVVVVLHEQHRPQPVPAKFYREIQLQPPVSREVAENAVTPSAAVSDAAVRPDATAPVVAETPAKPKTEAAAPAPTPGKLLDREMSLLAQAKARKAERTLPGSTRASNSLAATDSQGAIVTAPKPGDAPANAGLAFNGPLAPSAASQPATVGGNLMLSSGGSMVPGTSNNSLAVGGSLTLNAGSIPTDRLAAAHAPGGGVDLYPGPARAAQPVGTTGNSFGTVSSPKDSEIVQLSPFTVSAPTRGLGATVRGWFSGNTKIAEAGTPGLAAGSANFVSPESRGVGPRLNRREGNTESYAFQHDNDFLAAAQNPFSTFAVDVDTASYANVRRFVASGRVPPADAVRIEELLNYFPYHYPAPSVAADGAATASSRPTQARGEGTPPTNAVTAIAPFAASLEVAEAPWAPSHRLVRIGLKGREVSQTARPAANLVFLLDVSGSMDMPAKLPLVKESMRLLVNRLRPDDRVAIVTYAGESGLALPSTPVAQAHEIMDALDALSAGGSTNGGMGIQLAYDIAKANFAPNGINRVILCTDGDFNVGVTSEGALVRLIQEKAKSGVFLTVLGFGMGNFKDSMLEKLADTGNGNYGYIDSRKEAEKLLVEQVNGTLVTVAKDVKVQVEFNPAKVASYRLIGYEDRLLKPEDFNNDKVDAGEIGAGHTVTALYEIVPVGVDSKNNPATEAAVDDRRYRKPDTGNRRDNPQSAIRDPKFEELLTVKVRYKEPAGDVSQKLEFPLADTGEKFAAASADFKFAAAVAEYGMILRHSPHQGTATMGDVIAWAAAGGANPADDPGGYRSEFLELARETQMLLR